MESTDDPKLRELLKEWRVPGAPTSLDARVLGRRERWWKFLLTGSIRIPAPLALTVAVLLLAMGVALARRPGVAVKRTDAPVNLVGFRPVDDPQVRVFKGEL